METLNRADWEKLTSDEKWEAALTLNRDHKTLLAILSLLPPCPLHGDKCLSFAIDFVKAYAGLLRSGAMLHSTVYPSIDNPVSLITTYCLAQPILSDNKNIPVMFFETRVQGGALNGQTEAYADQQEARLGHVRMIELVSNKGG